MKNEFAYINCDGCHGAGRFLLGSMQTKCIACDGTGKCKKIVQTMNESGKVVLETVNAINPFSDTPVPIKKKRGRPPKAKK